MVKFEVNAYSLEEAKELALAKGMVATTNVTQSWSKAGSPTGNDFKIFCVDMLDKKHLSNVEGVGLIVATDPGSKDTRERPYKVENVVNEGPSKTKRVVEVRVAATGELVAEGPSKGEAIAAAKEVMKDVRADLIAEVVYRVQGGKNIAFRMKYVPSAKAKLGTYVIFGNEKKDTF